MEFESDKSVSEMLLHGGSVQTDSVPVRSPFFYHTTARDTSKDNNKTNKAKEKLKTSQQLINEASKRCKQIEMPKLFREEDNSVSLHDRINECQNASHYCRFYL